MSDLVPLEGRFDVSARLTQPNPSESQVHLPRLVGLNLGLHFDQGLQGVVLPEGALGARAGGVGWGGGGDLFRLGNSALVASLQ